MRISDWSSDVCSSDLWSPPAKARRWKLPIGRSWSEISRGGRAPHRSRPITSLRSRPRSEEHTSELQSLMRISYAVFCLKKKKNPQLHTLTNQRPYSRTTQVNTTYLL